jgi:hypothetical protein
MKFSFIALVFLIGIKLSAQVNPQNGSANYEIPIFSFSDSKSGLSTGVSLSYSSGNGLVVADKASSTGQNWVLSAGGEIIRKQNGEPDDQNSTVAFPTIPNGNLRGFNHSIALYDEDYQSVPWSGDPYSRNYIDNYYPNGYMYSEFPLDMVEQTQTNWPANTLSPRELALMPRFKSNMDKKWKLSRRALADRQQDVFVYNFNGASGEFVIGKDGLPQLLNDSKIIIDKATVDLTAQNIRTRINEFTIKDAQGIIYKFSAYELAEIMNFSEKSSEGPNSFRKVVTSGDPTGKYTIQKWLLTEIINPFTQEKIIFEYENYLLDFISDKTPSYQFTEGQSVESVQVHEQRSKGQLKRLRFITLPDGHKLEFMYGTYRYDVLHDLALSKIKVTYNENEVYSYNLTHGFFLRKEIKNSSELILEADRRFARLCLTSMNKSIGTNAEPAYKFNYYTGSESTDPKDLVPPFDCMAQDHWGYYNKATNVNIEDANPTKEVLKDLMVNNNTYRQPFSGAATLGLLKTVENPFGGKLTFEYEQNDSKDADNPTITKTTGGVRVFKTIVFDGVNTANNVVTNYNYKLSDGTTSGWGYESPTYLNRRQTKIWNASTLEGYTQQGVLKYDVSTAMAKFFSKSIANKAFSLAVKASFKKAFAEKVTSLVADCIAKDAAKQVATKLITPIPEPVGIIASYIISGLIDRLIILFNPTDYLWTDAYNFYPYQNAIGINYSRMEEVNTSIPGGMGKTVSEFTAPSNVRAEIPAFVMPYSPKQRFPAWKYGLPSKTQVYNQAGVLLNETINTYSIITNTITSDNHKSCKVELVRPESASCISPTGNLPLTDFSWEYYYPVTGRAELITSTEKNYSPSSLLAQADITKTYNSDYLEKTITTTKSNGDIITVKNYYTNDYNNISPAIQEMKNRNMLTTPISTETWLTKPNSTEYLLDASINEFVILPDGEIKLSKVYKLETKQPLLKSVIGEQSPTVLVRNTTYFKEQGTMIYDNIGLLKETTTPEGKISTQLYDYNNRVVTATVTNAQQLEVAYTSFETDQKGSWVYDLAYLTNGDAFMGKKYFHFPASASATITRQWTSARSGRVSFWIKGISPSVTYAGNTLSPFKTVPNTETGWTFYEYYFNGLGTLSINPSASAALDIDELRMYPKDARMATVAIDPLVGKTSECDVNNRIVYYEYDGLNRLKYVKDDKKNIIKKVCYNFAGEPENCLDATDTSPQWRDNGNTMCEPCPANGNYNSGVKLKQQSDQNPASPTYNTYRWAIDPSATCPSPPAWVPSNIYCAQSSSPPYDNTGYQVTVSVDINPCSQTYNQTQVTSVVYNPSACPIPIPCNPVCTEPEYKCINGVCVQGTWGIIKVKKIGKFGPWECTYAYCFPGGLISTYTQTITSSTACVVNCQ